MQCHRYIDSYIAPMHMTARDRSADFRFCVKITLFVALLRMMVELRPPLNDLRCVENEEIESPSA